MTYTSLENDTEIIDDKKVDDVNIKSEKYAFMRQFYVMWLFMVIVIALNTIKYNKFGQKNIYI